MIEPEAKTLLSSSASSEIGYPVAIVTLLFLYAMKADGGFPVCVAFVPITIGLTIMKLVGVISVAMAFAPI